MPRAKQDLTKHTLFLRRGDMEELQILYPEVGASVIIRKLISDHVDRIRAAAPQNLPKMEINL